jgi:hypothetical protein
MTIVVMIHNRTRATTKFLGMVEGYLCDVDTLTDAHIYPALYKAHEEVREFLNRPNVQMGERTVLDPVISNVSNLIPGAYNEVDFEFCELSLKHTGTIIAAIDESESVPRSQIIS